MDGQVTTFSAARASGTATLALCLALFVTGCSTLGPRTDDKGAQTPQQAVQQAIAARLGIAVMLDVETARSHQDWMFLAGRPLTEDGRPIDYTRTSFAQDVAEGAFDDSFSALVRRDARADGGWGVVELSLGATDAPFVGWFERHGLPLDLASRGPAKD